jgi:hemerythrin-like domain-containing protein
MQQDAATGEYPVGSLKAEHQVILRVIRVLTTLMDRFADSGAFPEAPLGRCVEFLRLFADACHHGKEEDLLFPVLEARGIPRSGGPIEVMLYEHQLGRQLTRQMGEALARVVSGDASSKSDFVQAAREYIDLLTRHIFKEDNILFNLGDRVMTADDQRELARSFCAVNCRVFEGRRREQLGQIADELEAEFPV